MSSAQVLSHQPLPSIHQSKYNMSTRQAKPEAQAKRVGGNTQNFPQERETKGSSAVAPRKVKFNVGELLRVCCMTCSSSHPCPGTNYQVIDVIGEGAYGVVISALHKPSGTKVAIKKIAPFEHAMFALRTLRELKLLKYFAEEGVSENVSCCVQSERRISADCLQIISVLDIIKPLSFNSFEEGAYECLAVEDD